MFLTLAASIIAEPPVRFNRQQVEFLRQNGVILHFPKNEQIVPQNIQQQRNIVPRAVQHPVQAPQYQQRHPQQERQVRQNIQNQAKFRRNPQTQDFFQHMTRPLPVPTNQQNFQKQPVRQLAPTGVSYKKPKKNVRVVKSPSSQQFRQVQIQPMLHVRGVHMHPVKVQREAANYEYSTLFKREPAVPLDKPPASYGVPGQQSGFDQESDQHQHQPQSSHHQQQQHSGYPQSHSSAHGSPSQSLNHGEFDGGFGSGSNFGQGASAGGQGGDQGYGYEKPQQGFADGEYSSGAHMFESDDEFMKNVESALDSSFTYEQQDVGENSLDGIELDDKLLQLMRDVLIDEENINLLGPLGVDVAQGGNSVEKPFPKYGTPEMQDVDPRGTSSGSLPAAITGVELDEIVPSIQVAQYLGLKSKDESGASASGSSSSGASVGGNEEFQGYQYNKKQRF